MPSRASGSFMNSLASCYGSAQECLQPLIVRGMLPNSGKRLFSQIAHTYLWPLWFIQIGAGKYFSVVGNVGIYTSPTPTAAIIPRHLRNIRPGFTWRTPYEWVTFLQTV